MKNYTHLTLYLPSTLMLGLHASLGQSWPSSLAPSPLSLVSHVLATPCAQGSPPGMAEPCAPQQYTFPLHFEAVIC